MDLLTFAIATAAGLFGFWLNLVFWPPVQRFGGIRKTVREHLEMLERQVQDDGAEADACSALQACAEDLAAVLGNLSGLYWRYLELRKLDPAQAVVELRSFSADEARRPMLERIGRVRGLLGLKEEG